MMLKQAGDKEVLKALSYLVKKDEVLRRLVKDNGFEFRPLEYTPYEALLQSIIYQQLSNKAAKATLSKFLNLFGGYPDPDRLIVTADDKLRRCGISYRKIKYLKEVALYAKNNFLDSKALSRMCDEDIMRRLDSIPGIGPWTVHMLLIFVLRRLDVFPFSDLGIRKALKVNYDLPKIPSEKEALVFSERWRPYRTVAALILWRSLDKSPWP